jgi:hypothetical protein
MDAGYLSLPSFFHAYVSNPISDWHLIKIKVTSRDINHLVLKSLMNASLVLQILLDIAGPCFELSIKMVSSGKK